jgi:hypothetical protein
VSFPLVRSSFSLPEYCGNILWKLAWLSEGIDLGEEASFRNLESLVGPWGHRAPLWYTDIAIYSVVPFTRVMSFLVGEQTGSIQLAEAGTCPWDWKLMGHLGNQFSQGKSSRGEYTKKSSPNRYIAAEN